MVDYKGIFPQGDLVPAPCGLLGVANVTEPTARDAQQYLRPGASAEFETTPQLVRILSLSETEVTDGTVYEAPAGWTPKDNFGAVEPFFIEIKDYQSALGIVGEDRLARAEKQLRAISQKAVEFELWTGAAAKESGTDETYLTKTGAATVLGTGGVSPRAALSLLEQAIADQSPTGGGGIIHMTRDVASAIGGLGPGMSYQTDERGYSFLITSLGTPVVVGSGYTGSGPDGTANAAPDVANKWAYVTGPVSVFLGEIEEANTINQGFEAKDNNVLVTNVRAASVYFDDTIHAAVRVTIPDLQ